MIGADDHHTRRQRGVMLRKHAGSTAGSTIVGQGRPCIECSIWSSLDKLRDKREPGSEIMIYHDIMIASNLYSLNFPNLFGDHLVFFTGISVDFSGWGARSLQVLDDRSWEVRRRRWMEDETVWIADDKNGNRWSWALMDTTVVDYQNSNG
jgi:hypothetical protein